MRKVLIYILISLITISCGGGATGVLTLNQIAKRDVKFKKEQDRLRKKYYREKVKKEKQFEKRKTK